MRELEALPKGLSKLISLRHLEITTKQPVLPYSEITNLISLALLSIDTSHNMESIFGGVKFPTLKTLCVVDCHSLKSLPLDVTNFLELEILVVENCVNLDLDLWKEHHEEQNPKLKLKFVGFWDLPQLTLFIKNCENLEMLSEWLSTLTNLESLLILDCPMLISLPDNIHHLTALEHLQIIGPKYHISNTSSLKNQKSWRKKKTNRNDLLTHISVEAPMATPGRGSGMVKRDKRGEHDV
ncbi:Disease resistance protein TAO1 [Glycine soja]